MMTLVINAGSSSVTFTLFRSGDLHPVAAGLVGLIAMSGTGLHNRHDRGARLTRSYSAGTIRHSPGPISTLPREPETGVVSSANDTSALGHRVARSGERLTGSVLIDDPFLLRHRAPLHNPPSLEGIEACRDLFPGAFQSAVFDTVFHNTLPGDVHLCALPYALHETKRIRPSCVHPIGQRGLSAEQVDTLLNGEGGVFGLNGIVSSDLRGIEATAGQGDHGSSGGSGSLRIV